jgi:hypothetical protein
MTETGIEISMTELVLDGVLAFSLQLVIKSLSGTKLAGIEGNRLDMARTVRAAEQALV